MAFDKRNASQFLARVRRHYNLQADEIIAVDEFAMMLTGAKRHGAFYTIAMRPEVFDRVAKFPLDCADRKGYLKVLDGVIARRANPAELESLRWMGPCWSVTREYLVAERNAILMNPKTSRKRQEEVQAELNLLGFVDATLPLTSNKAKGMSRIQQVLTEIDVPLVDCVLIDETIGHLVDDIKATNNQLIIGIPFTQLERLRKSDSFPKETEFYSGETVLNGHEVNDSVYVVSINAKLHHEVRNARGRYSNGNTPFTYYSGEFL